MDDKYRQNYGEHNSSLRKTVLVLLELDLALNTSETKV